MKKIFYEALLKCQLPLPEMREYFQQQPEESRQENKPD